jgi:hypothetical protein
MVEERITLYRLLAALCDRQQQAWFAPPVGPHPKALSAYEKLVTEYRPVRATEVERSLTCRSALDFRSQREAVYLTPPKGLEHFVPVLMVKCCFEDSDGTKLDLRLMLISFSEDDRLHGLGYRMEFGNKKHAFPHAQLVRGFHPAPDRDKLAISCPSWLPETQPSFLIPATGPVTLLLIMLISLYGLEYTQHFERTAVPGIGQYVNGMSESLCPSSRAKTPSST